MLQMCFLLHFDVGNPVLISCPCRSAHAEDSNTQAVGAGEQAPPSTGSGGRVKQKSGRPCRKSFTQMHLDAGQVCFAYVHKRMSLGEAAVDASAE